MAWESNEKSIFGIYKLSRGETLQKVATKFALPIFLLSKANKSVKIAEGVSVVIPNIKYQTHVVTPTDTIENICEKFEITREEFKEKNGEEYIYCGMIISV